ncbi:MAG: hypothetical protein WA906_04085 [Pacificimonas sp.]
MRKAFLYILLTAFAVMIVPFIFVWAGQTYLAYNESPYSQRISFVKLHDTFSNRVGYLYDGSSIHPTFREPNNCEGPKIKRELFSAHMQLTLLAERTDQDLQEVEGLEEQYHPAQATALTACMEASILAPWCNQKVSKTIRDLDIVSGISSDGSAGYYLQQVCDTFAAFPEDT